MIHHQEEEPMDEEQTMDKTGYFALRSPRLAHGWYDGYITVPEEDVYGAIEALRVWVAQWDAFNGDEPADEASRARVADAAQALADLMRAMAYHEREGGVRELVRQIAHFMSKREAGAYLDALRERLQREKPLESLQKYTDLQRVRGAESEMLVSEMADALEILDALIGLHETRQRRARDSREHPEEGGNAARE
jgi:hypothetical protein